MTQAFLIIGTLFAVAVIAAASTQLLHTKSENSPTPLSSSPVASITPEGSPTPETSSPSPVASGQVQGTFTPAQPSRKLSPTPSFHPSPTPTHMSSPTSRSQSVSTSSTQTSPSIEIISAPDHVASGESFQIVWRVVGPEGTQGSDATLKSTQKYESTSSGSSVRSSTNNSQSYGSFTVPKTFSSTFSFGVPEGEVLFELSAIVNGQTLHKLFSVRID